MYFKTEPMEHGERGKPLDFSLIPETLPLLYKRAASGKTKAELDTIRQSFKKRFDANKQKKPAITYTPPVYDDEFYEAMEKLEEIPATN